MAIDFDTDLWKRIQPETDGQRLDRLEKVWGAYGPLRPVLFDFTYAVQGDDGISYEDAEKLAGEVGSLLSDRGLAVSGWSHETRMSFAVDLEPSLGAILEAKETIWAALGKEQADFREWRYAAPLSVSFYPVGRNRANTRTNEQAAKSRGRALFGERPVEDPLGKSTGAAFEIDPGQFLERARRRAPADPAPTASAFSQWVYSLYSGARGDEVDRARGKTGEEAIWALRRQAEGSLDASKLRDAFPGWRLVHNGLHLGGRPEPIPFPVASLRVGGVPLRVSPDLVYRHSSTGEVIIVEMKNSSMPLPTNLWPNLWAQLWCYAHIDVALDAPKVMVVGEVWANHTVYYRRSDPSERVSLRASVRRNPRVPAYARFFERLFDIYRGDASR